MMGAPKFEVVRTSAEQPWHVRRVAGNGEVEWSSESYASLSDATACVFRNQPSTPLVVVLVDERTGEPS